MDPGVNTFNTKPRDSSSYLMFRGWDDSKRNRFIVAITPNPGILGRLAAFHPKAGATLIQPGSCLWDEASRYWWLGRMLRVIPEPLLAAIRNHQCHFCGDLHFGNCAQTSGPGLPWAPWALLREVRLWRWQVLLGGDPAFSHESH